MTNQDAPAAPPLIGALLRAPWEAVRDRMLAGVHERGFADLTAAHLSVLQYPGPDRVRPSDLAARTGMSKQALNYLLGQMERGGYLHRGVDPDDHRSRRIQLTDRGRGAMSAIREIVTDVETEWEGRLGGRRFAELRALLVDLNAVATPLRGTNDDS